MDEPWQIDLVDMSKTSKHNDGFKFVMVVIDISTNYAWLNPVKSRYVIAIKNALEHIFSKTIRCPNVIRKDKVWTC